MMDAFLEPHVDGGDQSSSMGQLQVHAHTGLLKTEV